MTTQPPASPLDSAMTPTETRLVPVEPTPEMMNAAWVVFRNSSWHDLTPSDIDRSVGTGAFREAWRTMLNAAPASPLPGGGQLSKNLGQLKSGQCSGIAGELSGWQDISTAPKDGTRIIGLLKSGRAVTIVSKKHHNGWIKTEGGGYVPNGILDDVWSEEEAGAFVPRNPTHWMPLPAAPTGEPK